MNAEELKPCPFCGGEATTYADAWVGCSPCEMWAESTHIWNRRAQLSAQSVSAVQPVADAAEIFNDINRTPGNTMSATAKHLASLGYRKAHPADADAVDAKRWRELNRNTRFSLWYWPGTMTKPNAPIEWAKAIELIDAAISAAGNHKVEG